MVIFGTDDYEWSRCKYYGTTLYSCTCMGYKRRKSCRHVEFMRKKKIEKDDKTDSKYKEILASIANGDSAVSFVDKYGEDLLEQMKVVGDVWEKGNKLFVLK